MSSPKNSNGGRIWLSPLSPNSRIPMRVPYSSSDSEQSTDEVSGLKNRPSGRTRIPVAVSRENRGSHSDSSEEDCRTPNPKVTDKSGSKLKKGQGKEVIANETVKNPGHVSLPSKKSDWVKSGKSLSLRDTKASALRRQAQLKKAAVLSEKPKHAEVKKPPTVHCSPIKEDFSDTKDHDSSESELEENLDEHAPTELREAVNDKCIDGESSSETTPSLDLSLVPLSAHAQDSRYNSTDKEGIKKCTRPEAADEAKKSQEFDDKEERSDGYKLEDESSRSIHDNEHEAADSYFDESFEEESFEEDITPSLESSKTSSSVENGATESFSKKTEGVKGRRPENKERATDDKEALDGQNDAHSSVERDNTEELSSETADFDKDAFLASGQNGFYKQEGQQNSWSYTEEEAFLSLNIAGQKEREEDKIKDEISHYDYTSVKDENRLNEELKSGFDIVKENQFPSETNVTGENELEDRKTADDFLSRNESISVKDCNTENITYQEDEKKTIEKESNASAAEMSRADKKGSFTDELMGEEIKWMKRTSSTSSEDEELEQEQEQWSSKVEQQLCELEKEHSMMLEEFVQVSEMARPLVQEIKSESPLIHFQKGIKSVRDELRHCRDEGNRASKKKRRGKVKYKKLKKRLIYNEKRINFLVETYQRDDKDYMQMAVNFQREIQRDIKQLRIWLKQASDDKCTRREAGKNSNKEESLESGLKKIKELLEKTALRLELQRVDERQSTGKSEDLVSTCQEVKKCLEEKEWDLKSIKAKLKEKDDRVEELNRKLQQEGETKAGLRKSHELAKESARQQATNTESEISKLRQLFSDTKENNDSLQEQLRKTKVELEDTKNVLAQRDTDLNDTKASLCEGDKLLNNYRQILIEMQQELGKTERALMEKDEELEASTKYADCEIEMIKEVVTKVVRDVTRVEEEHVQVKSLWEEKERKLEEKELCIVQLRRDLQLQGSFLKQKEHKFEELEISICQFQKDLESNNTSLKGKDDKIEDLESSIAHLKTELEKSSISLREKDNSIKDLESSVVHLKKDFELSSSSLKEKDNEIEDLETYVTQLKDELELASASSKDKDNELQQIKNDFRDKDRELNISKGKSGLLQEEINSLQNESVRLKTHLCQQEDEIKELKTLVLTKDSELRTENSEMIKLKHLLQEQDKRLDFMKRALASKEHDNDILTGNMKKRFLEIRNLQRTLDEARKERSKLSELCELKTKYFETKINRLNVEVQCNSILLGKKDKELETANLGIRDKVEELDNLKERLCTQKVKFQLYRKISTEAECQLLQEKSRDSERTIKDTETGLCEEDSGQVKVERGEKSKTSDPEKVDDRSSEESTRQGGDGKSETALDKQVREGNSVTMTDRFEQMEADMKAMKRELESSRDENATLSEENEELKEKVDDLQKEADEKRKRLNNTLENVRMKAAENRRLEALLRKQEKPQYEEDSPEEPKAPESPESAESSIVVSLSLSDLEF